MITSSRFLCLFCLFTSLSFPGFSQDTPLRTDFSGKTAEENKLTIMGAGFGAMPLAKVAFGDVITDNVFAGATDGKGGGYHSESGRERFDLPASHLYHSNGIASLFGQNRFRGCIHLPGFD